MNSFYIVEASKQLEGSKRTWEVQMYGASLQRSFPVSWNASLGRYCGGQPTIDALLAGGFALRRVA